jgi:hypothetical protein
MRLAPAQSKRCARAGATRKVGGTNAGAAKARPAAALRYDWTEYAPSRRSHGVTVRI